MKTLHIQETELKENGISTRLNHKNFLELTSKTPFARTKKIVRNVDKGNLNMLSLFGLEDHTAQLKISIHPEFVAYAFHLYGLARKLFLYIIFYEVNNDNCKFTIDKATMQRFREFCTLFGEAEESEKAILQAARSLIRKNAMILLEGEEYMLNPLIAGGSNESKRRKLIDVYSSILEGKGLDSSVHYYPKYQITL